MGKRKVPLQVVTSETIHDDRKAMSALTKVATQALSKHSTARMKPWVIPGVAAQQASFIAPDMVEAGLSLEVHPDSKDV